MEAMNRIQRALNRSIEHALAKALEQAKSPALLSQALRHAVFPGGARLRPKLCLAVACAIGDDDPALADAAASSIELMHCASLVHDDLPCFDNAPTRRGRPSVHAAYGERLAVLAGDALIVLAFQNLLNGSGASPQRLPALISILSKSVGVPHGIIAGQAWECEPMIELERYHLEKTGALFAAATMAGAAAAGDEPARWKALGQNIGLAFQVADDINDVFGDAALIGKPVGNDKKLGRPNAARDLGKEGALNRLKTLIEAAKEAIPVCAAGDDLRALIGAEVSRFLPPGLIAKVA